MGTSLRACTAHRTIACTGSTEPADDRLRSSSSNRPSAWQSRFGYRRWTRTRTQSRHSLRCGHRLDGFLQSIALGILPNLTAVVLTDSRALLVVLEPVLGQIRRRDPRF